MIRGLVLVVDRERSRRALREVLYAQVSGQPDLASYHEAALTRGRPNVDELAAEFDDGQVDLPAGIGQEVGERLCQLAAAMRLARRLRRGTLDSFADEYTTGSEADVLREQLAVDLAYVWIAPAQGRGAA